MKRLVLIVANFSLAAALLTACGPTDNAADHSPTGHIKDDPNLVQIPVQQGWRTDLEARTMTAVKKEALPKIAKFDDAPRAEAYYDKVRRLTRVSFYGNVRCQAPDTRESIEGYYVTWEYPGDIQNTAHVDPYNWALMSVQVYENEQF